MATSPTVEDNIVVTNMRMIDVQKDFTKRREGLVKSLTKDFKAVLRFWDKKKRGLGLYGLRSEGWLVKEISRQVPHETPEPLPGLHLVKDKENMTHEDWPILIAQHCDAWLVELAHHYATEFDFNEPKRRKLMEMITKTVTITEEVIEHLAEGKATCCVCDGQLDPNKEIQRIRCNKCGNWFHKLFVGVDNEKGAAQAIIDFKCPPLRPWDLCEEGLTCHNNNLSRSNDIHIGAIL